MSASPGNLPLEIDVQSVKSMLDKADDFLLVDCREQDEFNHVRIAGSTFIPMGQIPARIGELEAHRGRRIVVHCHHGGRSLQVTHWLRGQGFDDVQSMAGGIDDWSLEIDPSLPRY
jgi:rhodanese-related sulfurtransferase